jgi:hypothetical protein
MALIVVPPTFDTIYEQQQFISTLTFYDGTTPVNNISSVVIDYQIGGVGDYLSLPTGLSSQLITTGTGAAAYKEIRLQGRWPQYTVASSWVTQPVIGNSSTASFANYETVVSDGTPYFSARSYNADTSLSTTVVIRIRASLWTAALGNFEEIVYPTQSLENNWNRKRNQVIPFVQGGEVDAETFRFPGGSLGGAVGQDLPEPGAAAGISLFPINLVYEQGSGVFTVPLSVSSITVRLYGGGGSGGRGYAFGTYSASGGGGGGGGYVEFTTSVTTGQNFTWSVGVGGSSETDGIGGTTRFGENYAFGGQPGRDGLLENNLSTPTGGAGGIPNGQAGRPGLVARSTTGTAIPDQVGGDGADAVDPNIGQGGDGGDKTTPTGVAGQPGTGFSSGGGGAGTQRGTVQPWPGANGQPGRLTISYLGSRFIFNDTITVNVADYDVRTAALAAGWDGNIPLAATITVLGGVYVYSTTTTNPAFSYANLPANTVVNLINNGSIIGKGGNGGTGLANGSNGGPAIVLNSLPVFITNNGTIAGGGGGGGGGHDPFTGLAPSPANAGGGGGAGGGTGGNGLTFPGPTNLSGGAGGLPGSAGSAGSGSSAAGGGGGRITPGTGGAGAQVVAGALQAFALPGAGGGAGGGGGAFAFDGTLQGATGRAGSGGSADANGGNATAATRFGPNFDGAGAAGGGGGWGAAGGRGMRPVSTFITVGGVGGKAVDTQGFTVNFSSTGTIYGAVSGVAPISGVFSTAVVSNQQNLNLRTYAVNSGWNQIATAVVTIAGGVYVWTASLALHALTIDGNWPNGVTLDNQGYIMGQGGLGGTTGAFPGTTVNGEGGGPAIRITLPIILDNRGYIGGGGGGGGAGSWWADSINDEGGGGGGGGAGGGAGGSARGSSQGTFGNVGGIQSFGMAGATTPGTFGQSKLITGGGLEGYGAAGGGRIMPGAPAVAWDGVSPLFTSPPSVVSPGGSGGGAGGRNQGYQAPSSTGGTGGGGNSAGGPGLQVNQPVAKGGGGGGGGGWGAAGGSGIFSSMAGGGGSFTVKVPAGVGGPGGKAINTSGNTITYIKIGNLWGAVG